MREERASVASVHAVSPCGPCRIARRQTRLSVRRMRHAVALRHLTHQPRTTQLSSIFRALAHTPSPEFTTE